MISNASSQVFMQLPRLRRLRSAGYTGTVSLETDLPLSAPQLASTAAFLRTI